MTRIETHSPGETLAFGRSFAKDLVPGDVIALEGALGSGKTQFVKGACEGLGVRQSVTSPTFTLVNEYPAPFGAVIHVDLYRIGTRAELAELGVEEYFSDRCVTFIEWAESVADLLPEGHWAVQFEYGRGEQDRVLCVRGRPR
jgi:tRNA threonylcarbamoyladenosine biosynthesis protein TsaE